jgi:hypothetical protein
MSPSKSDMTDLCKHVMRAHFFLLFVSLAAIVSSSLPYDRELEDAIAEVQYIISISQLEELWPLAKQMAEIRGLGSEKVNNESFKNRYLGTYVCRFSHGGTDYELPLSLSYPFVMPCFPGIPSGSTRREQQEAQRFLEDKQQSLSNFIVYWGHMGHEHSIYSARELDLANVQVFRKKNRFWADYDLDMPYSTRYLTRAEFTATTQASPGSTSTYLWQFQSIPEEDKFVLEPPDTSPDSSEYQLSHYLLFSHQSESKFTIAIPAYTKRHKLPPLQASIINDAKVPLKPGPYEETFPSLSAVATEISSLDLGSLLRELKRQREAHRKAVTLFGVTLPFLRSRILDLSILLAAWLYFCIHLHKLQSVIATGTHRPLFPWIGLYEDPFSRLLCIGTSVLAPFASLCLIVRNPVTTTAHIPLQLVFAVGLGLAVLLAVFQIVWFRRLWSRRDEGGAPVSVGSTETSESEERSADTSS